MQVEESIMCQAELAEVCLGHRNGIISGIQYSKLKSVITMSNSGLRLKKAND